MAAHRFHLETRPCWFCDMEDGDDWKHVIECEVVWYQLGSFFPWLRDVPARNRAGQLLGIAPDMNADRFLLIVVCTDLVLDAHKILRKEDSGICHALNRMHRSNRVAELFQGRLRIILRRSRALRDALRRM